MNNDVTEIYADGTVVERAFTDAELQQQAADTAWDKAEADVLAARATAREALLERLGITDEEARMLLS